MLFPATAGGEMARLRSEIRRGQLALSLVRRGDFLARWREDNPGKMTPRVVVELLMDNRRARRRLRFVMTRQRECRASRELA